MSAENFVIHDHKLPAQHIRELPNALAVDEGTPEATLYLSVKQYIPRNNTSPRTGDITIIALHASGYSKELYEPLWDDLLFNLPENIRLRGIWIADMAQHGSSYLLNERKLASGISWDDHGRDILHLVNTYREDMVPPIIGVGHSMGAAQLIHLCQLHPRLFHSVAFLDPWLSLICKPLTPDHHWKISVARKKTFQSMQDARDTIEKVLLFKTWDRRCFNRYMLTAFRNVPTMLDTQGSGMAPMTPAIMAFHTSRRVMPEPIDMDLGSQSRIDRLAYPDRVHDFPVLWPYCMPQAIDKARFLPHLRPRVLFLYGENKASCIRPELRKGIKEITGTDSGGSGGVRLGCVEDDVVGGGHFFPFENPKGTAERLATWLQKEQTAWRDEKVMLDDRYGHGVSAEQRQQFPPPFPEVARNWAKHESKL